MATAIKRGKTWTAIWERGRGEDGKRLQGTKGGFRIKKAPASMPPSEAAKVAALDYATAQERAVGDGTFVQPIKETLGAFMERWLRDYAEQRTRPRTLEVYASLNRKHVAPKLGKQQLGKLQPAQVQGFYAGLLRQGATASTVAHVHRLLRQALSHAVKWGLLARNPADLVDPPKPSHKERPFIDQGQAAGLLQAAHGTSLYPLVILALYTGLRRGELLGLRWQDVDLENGALAVTQSVQRIRGKGVLPQPPKTANSRRRVVLWQETLALLRSHKAAQNERRLELGPLWRDEGYVFTGPDGGPMSPDTVTHVFGRLAERAGLKGLRFHDLRHAHASIMLASGVHAKVVSERLGHANIGITLDIYSHVLPGLQDAAAQAFDETMIKARLANG